MKYKIGQSFILATSNGPKQTNIVNIKYEFADYIKGGPKYVSEKELKSYIEAGVLLESDNTAQKEYDIKKLEAKYGIKLQEVK